MSTFLNVSMDELTKNRSSSTVENPLESDPIVDHFHKTTTGSLCSGISNKAEIFKRIVYL